MNPSDNSSPTFTVLTATYNRAHLLPRVYESLQKQTFRDFEWLIVDDGSTDNTSQVIRELERNAPFPIRYIAKTNGGKPTAVNRGAREAKGTLLAILDSDDWYCPQALERFLHHWQSIPENKRQNFVGITGLCAYPSGELIGTRFPQDVFDSDAIDLRYRHKVRGEKSGMLSTEILRQFPYPEDLGKYVSESLVWNRIAMRYQTRFVNEVLTVKDFQPGGITRDGRFIQVRDTRASLLCAKELMALGNRLPLGPRVRAYANFVRHSLHQGIPFAQQAIQAPSRSMLYLCYFLGAFLKMRDSASLTSEQRNRMSLQSEKNSAPKGTWSKIRKLQGEKLLFRVAICKLLFKSRLGRLVSFHFQGIRLRLFPSEMTYEAWKHPATYRSADRVFLERVLKPGDLVIDVGANIGVISIQSAKIAGPSGRVIAIEPNRRIGQYCLHNLRLNRLNNVTILQTALGNNVGSTSFNCDKCDDRSRVVADGGVNVPITTLDEIAESVPDRKINLLKIDVEGFELAVLRGARHSLQRTEWLYIEVDSENYAKYGNKPEDVITFLRQCGFDCFFSDGQGPWREVNGPLSNTINLIGKNRAVAIPSRLDIVNDTRNESVQSVGQSGQGEEHPELTLSSQQQ